MNTSFMALTSLMALGAMPENMIEVAREDDPKAYPPRPFERGVRGEKAKPKVKKSGGRKR